MISFKKQQKSELEDCACAISTLSTN